MRLNLPKNPDRTSLFIIHSFIHPSIRSSLHPYYDTVVTRKQWNDCCLFCSFYYEMLLRICQLLKIKKPNFALFTKIQPAYILATHLIHVYCWTVQGQISGLCTLRLVWFRPGRLSAICRLRYRYGLAGYLIYVVYGKDKSWIGPGQYVNIMQKPKLIELSSWRFYIKKTPRI